MAGEPEQSRAEQKAFANFTVTAGDAALGTVLAVLVPFIALPLLNQLPVWITYVLAVSLVVGIVSYFVIRVRLGGSEAGSEHREWYEEFRFGFLTDNFNGRYARQVQKIIAATDRFFGDAGQAGKSLFPRAFGLRLPAPLWTARSYDRCLLLALVYPLLAILIVWAGWGKEGMGQVEAALLMKPASDAIRVLALACVFGAGLASFQVDRATDLRAKAVWMAGGAGMGFGAFWLGSGATIVVIVFAMGTVGDDTETGAADVALSVSGALALAFAFALAPTFLLVLFVFLLVLVVIVRGLNRLLNLAGRSGRLGAALAAFSVILIAASLWPLPHWFGGAVRDVRPGTLLYFFGLLTLINAPFDWVAIGITRGLVRRGQELGKLWPLALALVDLLLSLVLMAVLAVLVLWATEVYNHAMISGGAGRGVIDVSAYLTALADPAQRSDPKYYWLYAMLFSSQIPAVANFALGALCLLRGLPAWNRWILSQLPEKGSIESWNRIFAAGLTAGQLALATASGLAAYYLLVAFLIRLIDPVFGAGLVDMLRQVSLAPLLK